MIAAPVVGHARDRFAIDWMGAAPDAAVAAFLSGQIALVERLDVSAEAAAFFAGETIHVDPRPGTRTRAGAGIYFARRVQPDDNPVLLHELIHRWQTVRMGGPRDPRIVAFWTAAKASGTWPAGSYMLQNPFEFFAMVASVVLHGRAARPPYTRAAVRKAMPDVYHFIVAEFGARLTD